MRRLFVMICCLLSFVIVAQDYTEYNKQHTVPSFNLSTKVFAEELNPDGSEAVNNSIFCGTDGVLYFKDNTGSVIDLLAGGGGGAPTPGATTIVAALSSDITIASQTSPYETAPETQITIPANTIATFTAMAFVETTNASNAFVRVFGPGTPDVFYAVWDTDNTNFVPLTFSAPRIMSFSTLVAVRSIHFEGVIATGSEAITIGVEFAQVTSSSTSTTLKKGSFLRINY